MKMIEVIVHLDFCLHHSQLQLAFPQAMATTVLRPVTVGQVWTNVTRSVGVSVCPDGRGQGVTRMQTNVWLTRPSAEQTRSATIYRAPTDATVEVDLRKLRKTVKVKFLLLYLIIYHYVECSYMILIDKFTIY